MHLPMLLYHYILVQLYSLSNKKKKIIKIGYGLLRKFPTSQYVNPPPDTTITSFRYKMITYINIILMRINNYYNNFDLIYQN